MRFLVAVAKMRDRATGNAKRARFIETQAADNFHYNSRCLYTPHFFTLSSATPRPFESVLDVYSRRLYEYARTYYNNPDARTTEYGKSAIRYLLAMMLTRDITNTGVTNEWRFCAGVSFYDV